MKVDTVRRWTRRLLGCFLLVLEGHLLAARFVRIASITPWVRAKARRIFMVIVPLSRAGNIP